MSTAIRCAHTASRKRRSPGWQSPRLDLGIVDCPGLTAERSSAAFETPIYRRLSGCRTASSSLGGATSFLRAALRFPLRYATSLSRLLAPICRPRVAFYRFGELARGGNRTAGALRVRPPVNEVSFCLAMRYRNGNRSSSNMKPPFIASLINGSGPRPSAKACSSVRRPCIIPGRP